MTTHSFVSFLVEGWMKGLPNVAAHSIGYIVVGFFGYLAISFLIKR